eukprot:8944300-Karenia_brevis.AAC.1
MPLNRLRAAVVRALWGEGRSSRCKEIVLTLFVRGHKVDPTQAIDYNCLASMHKLVVRREPLRKLIADIWDMRQHKPKGAYGPVKNVSAALSRLGWAWVQPFVFQTASGTHLDLLTLPAKQLQHEIREAQRTILWRSVACRRQDMLGIEFGIDRIATLSLLQSGKTEDYRKGVLRSIISGSIRTQTTLHKAGLVGSPLCPFCHSSSPEDVEHLWWHCSAWDAIRRKYWNPFFAFSECWPACFKQCGVMPDSHPSFDHLAWSTDPDCERSSSAALTPPLQTDVWHAERFLHGRVIVYTDGACMFNDDWRLRRAGYGAFWASAHALNVSAPLSGDLQSNQRAELQA